jgi:hypothetical protein
MTTQPRNPIGQCKTRLQFLASRLSGWFGLLRQQVLVNVGQDTALGNGDVAEELVQFLIVANGELEMARNDAGLLVVTGSVTSQLEDFRSQVLQDRGQVNGCA